MTVKSYQYLLAAVFFVLGGWCVASPSSVLDLAITSDYRSDAPIVPILMGAFGAQALIAGTFAAFARFTKATFIAYGVALLPFFAFDYWFYMIEPMLTWVGLLDAVGNVIMLAVCYLGWRAAGEEEEDVQPLTRAGGSGSLRNGKRAIMAASVFALVAADMTGAVLLTPFNSQAVARPGNPWTPLSGAGVARRTTRRIVRRTTLVVPVLPAGCYRSIVGGLRVWRCGNVYYQVSGSGYVVVVVK